MGGALDNEQLNPTGQTCVERRQRQCAASTCALLIQPAKGVV